MCLSVFDYFSADGTTKEGEKKKSKSDMFADTQDMFSDDYAVSICNSIQHIPNTIDERINKKYEMFLNKKNNFFIVQHF